MLKYSFRKVEFGHLISGKFIIWRNSEISGRKYNLILNKIIVIIKIIYLIESIRHIKIGRGG